MSTIARNFNLGVELHERALNKISATLYSIKPNLFEVREEIVVDPSTGRILSLYAFLDVPFAFNFHPIQNSNIIPGGIYAEASLTFTLTDKQPGNANGRIITRIKMQLQAALRLLQEETTSDQKISVYLDKVVFTGFASDHPQGLNVHTPSNTNDLVSVSNQLPSNDPSFVALLNYIIEVFLMKSLKKPLETFPFPPIHLVIEKNVSLYLRGLNTWGNTLGVYLGLNNGGPIQIQGNPPNAIEDLSIGITEETISVLLNALLPVRSIIEPTSNNKTFSIQSGSWIEIKRRTGPLRSSIDLIAPNKVRALIFFNAHINGRINIKLGKYWVRFDLPIPVGDPSSIIGAFIPFITNTEEEFIVNMRPGTNFFTDFGAIAIVTDYRRLIRDAVRDWLNRNVSPILRKIPIIGWIISKGVEVIVSELIGNFVGAPLDAMVSAFLSVISTALFNAARLFLKEDKLTFEVLRINKKLPGEEIPLRIHSVSNPIIDANANGELIIKANLDKPYIDVPEPPFPDKPVLKLIDSEKENVSVNPTDPTLFQPPFKLPKPHWINGETVYYEVNVTIDDTSFIGSQAIWAKNDSKTDRITLFINTSMSEKLGSDSRAQITFNAQTGEILEEVQSSWAETPMGPVEVKTSVVYDYERKLAIQERRFGETGPEVEELNIPDSATVLGSVHGIFQLCGQVHNNTSGKAARIDLNEEQDFSEFIPVDVEVANIQSAVYNRQTINVVEVKVSDRDFSGVAMFLADDPYRLISYSQKGNGIEVFLKLITDQ